MGSCPSPHNVVTPSVGRAKIRKAKGEDRQEVADVATGVSDILRLHKPGDTMIDVYLYQLNIYFRRCSMLQRMPS